MCSRGVAATDTLGWNDVSSNPAALNRAIVLTGVEPTLVDAAADDQLAVRR